MLLAQQRDTQYRRNRPALAGRSDGALTGTYCLIYVIIVVINQAVVEHSVVHQEHARRTDHQTYSWAVGGLNRSIVIHTSEHRSSPTTGRTIGTVVPSRDVIVNELSISRPSPAAELACTAVRQRPEGYKRKHMRMLHSVAPGSSGRGPFMKLFNLRGGPFG